MCIVDVVVDPRVAFRALAERPVWIVAFATAVALRFGSLFVFYQPAATPGKLVLGLLFQVGTIAPALIATTVVLWVAATAWRVGISWSTTFSIVAHVYLAHTLATIVVASIEGAVLPASVDIDLRNPPYTNPAAFVDASRWPVLRGLVAELDVRSAYALVLAGLGIQVAGAGVARWRVVGVIASCFLIRLALVAWSAPSR